MCISQIGQRRDRGRATLFKAGGQLVTVDRSAMRMESKNMEQRKHDAEMHRLTTETVKLATEAVKLSLEGKKYQRETLYYPFFAGVAAVGAGAALVKVFIKIL
jgi:hypothetical protein